MSVSGHKAESSIRSYSRTGLSTKRKMSENLSAFLNSKSFKPNFDFEVDADVETENICEDFDAVMPSPTHIRQINNNKNSMTTARSVQEKRIGALVENCDGHIQFSKCVFKL